jgi:hypothetical protein
VRIVAKARHARLVRDDETLCTGEAGFELSWRAFNWHAQREYTSMQRRAARSAAASLQP